MADGYLRKITAIIVIRATHGINYVSHQDGKVEPVRHFRVKVFQLQSVLPLFQTYGSPDRMNSGDCIYLPC